MEEKIVRVTNRNAGWTGYLIPDTGVRRSFSPKEAKNIPLSELQQLQYVAGGDYILRNCLLINDMDALTALSMENVEPEYFYTEDEVKKLLLEGSLDQLEDCLNFAPEGVIDLVKTVAVQIELPDIRKRNLISEKTGLNINNAITVNTIMNENNTTEEEKKETTRKATPITATESKPERKTVPVDKYKVVKK